MANTNLTELFTGIANSIRAKDGTSNPIAAINFADRINAIPTGGGTEFQYRTPDEIYEQDRPADWPVLPDPQEGECYFLFSRDSSSKLQVVYDEVMSSRCNQTSSWGYINENGEFVSVYSMERTGSSLAPTPSLWQWLGLSSVGGTEVENKMYPYYVLKTVGGVFYQGEGYSSPSSASLLGQYLLEAKINIPDARYILNRYDGSDNPSSSQKDYLNQHNNLKFITLYNGTGKNLQLRYLCYNKSALRCIRFDSEANNFFTNGNFNGGNSAAYMFYGAVSLQCMYPIDKLTTVKNINYLYNLNRYLPYLEIHSSTATDADRVIGASANCCKKASIILPSLTSNFQIGHCPPELINFQLPALSPANEYAIVSTMPSPYYYTGIIKNVNLLNFKCYGWTKRTTGGVSAITFTEDCPPPDGVTFDCCSFTHQTLQDMIDTLPTAEGATLTIKFESLTVENTPYYSSVGISQKERDAFIQQITDKGYTVSVKT